MKNKIYLIPEMSVIQVSSASSLLQASAGGAQDNPLTRSMEYFGGDDYEIL